MNEKKDKKKDVAAVSTYADHEVILPPNKLKKAVQKVATVAKKVKATVKKAVTGKKSAKVVTAGGKKTAAKKK